MTLSRNNKQMYLDNNNNNNTKGADDKIHEEIGESARMNPW